MIAVAVRWYLRYGPSYGNVEELLAERCVAVDHVTVYRWLQSFTSESIDAARPAHSTGRPPVEVITAITETPRRATEMILRR
jgi:IS6 family transposase